MVDCVAILAQTARLAGSSTLPVCSDTASGTGLLRLHSGKACCTTRSAQSDFRLDRPWLRAQKVLKFWFGQWKHPRYRSRARCIFLFRRLPHTGNAGLLSADIRTVDDFAATGASAAVRHCRGLRRDHRFPGGNGGRGSPGFLQACALCRSGEVRQRPSDRCHLLLRVDRAPHVLREPVRGQPGCDPDQHKASVSSSCRCSRCPGC